MTEIRHDWGWMRYYPAWPCPGESSQWTGTGTEHSSTAELVFIIQFCKVWKSATEALFSVWAYTLCRNYSPFYFLLKSLFVFLLLLLFLLFFRLSTCAFFHLQHTNWLIWSSGSKRDKITAKLKNKWFIQCWWHSISCVQEVILYELDFTERERHSTDFRKKVERLVRQLEGEREIIQVGNLVVQVCKLSLINSEDYMLPWVIIINVKAVTVSFEKSLVLGA